MGKPFALRLKPTSKSNCNVIQDVINKKQNQLNAAVKWCTDNNRRGFSAIQSGMFPLVKSYKTINKRLDGEITTGREKEYCSILTNSEEEDIVRHIKNKNRCMQGMNRKEISEFILQTLHVRKKLCQKENWRRVKKLSPNATRAMKTKTLSKSFWRRFDAKYRRWITRKRQGTVSINRALNCTREMGVSHLDELAEELKNCGIFTDAIQKEPGVWEGNIDSSRIFNHDETPQFVNYGVDGTANGLVYSGKGESCQKMLRENRECVTVHPFVSFAGDIDLCHVIFKGTGITSHMAPEVAVTKIPNLLISTTDSGTQDHTSLLAAYKKFDKVLIERNVTRPVVVLSDGHSSRFDSDILSFLRSVQIFLFLGPPDTTSVTQLLDQINQALHHGYRASKAELFSPSMTINREGFMTILADMWSTWTTSKSIMKAGKRVGISANGLSVEWMQQDKFERAAESIDESLGSDAGPSTSSPVISSPANVRKNSAAYWKAKYEAQGKIIQELSSTSISLDDIPGFLKVDKVKPKKTEAQRVTQIHGSMEGHDVLAVVEKIKRAKEDKEIAQENKKIQQQQRVESFFKCKTKCTCKIIPCEASRLRECSNCHNVLLSICSKSLCKGKSTMIKPAGAQAVCKKLDLPLASDSDGTSDEDDMATLTDSDDSSAADGLLEDDGSFKTGDYVKIVKGSFKGLYATVLGESYGDEIEIQYFEKKFSKWIVKDKDIDSREPGDLIKVAGQVDKRDRYTFSE